MTRNLILGIEVVLSDGEIISSMKKITKDNSGYDIKQLFIGSEGTLGIISKVIFKLEEKPSSSFSALAGLKNYENVINFLKFKKLFDFADVLLPNNISPSLLYLNFLSTSLVQNEDHQ